MNHWTWPMRLIFVSVCLIAFVIYIIVMASL